MRRFETVKQAGEKYLKSVTEDPALENHQSSLSGYFKIVKNAVDPYGSLEHYWKNIVGQTISSKYLRAKEGEPIGLNEVANYAVTMTNRLWEIISILNEKNMSPVEVFNIVMGTVDAVKGNRKINVENIDLLNNISVNKDTPVRSFMIFSNLIGNAIKYSPDGSTIIIRAAVEEVDSHSVNLDNGCTLYVGDRSYVTLSIEDEGIGIPPEEQKAILENNKPLRGSNVGNIQGTGQGMRELANTIDAWHLTEITSPLHPDAPEGRKGTRIKVFL